MEVDFPKFMPVHLRMADIVDDSFQSLFHEISFGYLVFQFVNMVYSVNSVYSLKSVIGFAFSLAILLQMVFSAHCVCSKHDTWRHGEVVAGDLRVAAIESFDSAILTLPKTKAEN